MTSLRERSGVINKSNANDANYHANTTNFICSIRMSFVDWHYICMFFGLFKKKDEDEVRTMRQKMDEVKELLKSDSSLSWRMAVIEADKLMDSALKRTFTRGETMGERLKAAVFKNPKIRKVWEAHSLRNDLVHESDRHLSRSEAERAVKLFEEGMKDLKVL